MPKLKLQLIFAPTLPTTGVYGAQKGELGENTFPPLGILYLASYVRKFFPDVNIKITDGFLKGKDFTQKEIINFSPEIVGISCLTGNATGAYELSKLIKKRFPKILIVIGGPHASWMQKDTLKRSHADFVAVGEGEEILKQIVSECLKLKSNSHLIIRNAQIRNASIGKIPGLAYLKNNRVVQNPLMPLIKNLDDIPFPARDLVNLDDYKGWSVAKNRPEANIFSIRGCPFNCHFCSKGVWKLQKPYLRVRSPKNVLDEVDELINKYGYREYHDLADEINSSYEWTISLCLEKIRRKLTIPWKCLIRADKVTPELARLLKQSGCWYVEMGIESGNPQTLVGINKKINLEMVEKSCRLLQNEGIKICGLFMLFNAWEEKGKLCFESPADSLNTLKYANQLVKNGLLNNITWSQATPYPSSELYLTAQKYHLIPKKYQGRWEYWNHNWSFVMKLPGISTQDLLDLKIKGNLLQAIVMVKTGNLHLNNLPYLLTKGFGLLKRFVLLRFSRLFL